MGMSRGKQFSARDTRTKSGANGLKEVYKPCRSAVPTALGWPYRMWAAHLKMWIFFSFHILIFCLVLIRERADEILPLVNRPECCFLSEFPLL